MLRFILKKKLLSSVILFIIFLGFAEEKKIYVKLFDIVGIREIELEDYISGVVAKEMGEKFPIEALKAQAVVSRTYLIWKKLTNKNNLYDIENSIYNQVFGYCNSEKIMKAIEETKGEILISPDGKIVPVFFHASSGGITTNPSDVWGGEYLFNTSTIDPYSEQGRYSYWKKIIPKKYLSKIFGFEINKIEIIERDKTNRVKFLKLLSKYGKILNLKGNDFRLKVNENTKIDFNNPYFIPSTLFDIKETEDSFIFEGKGYGHGVGMSQEGAKKMAEAGYDYIEILKFYFNGLEIGKLY
ncbi:MAG: SpoIID/LytB domain-containing protein [Candidatus Omnitrophica bacterium]|nr:SpoIID/LytB domain-containing protein [Candidatus Omnitrophota bacterium]